MVKGCIMHQQSRIFIPATLRETVLQLFHENHPGVVGMKALVRSLIWYPGLDKDITDMVLSCKICQANRSKPANTNTVWPEPTRTWSRIHADHFFYDNYVCLLVVDSLSRYIEVEVVKTTSVSETIDALSCIFARNGLPDTLVTDNASCFTAYDFQQFLSRNGIEHLTPSPGTPQANGRAERSVRVIKDLLKKCQFTGSLKYRLSKVLLQYRTVPHSVTQVSPAVSLNSRKLITLRDRLNPKYCALRNKSQCIKIVPQFEIGSNILALNLGSGPKWYNATIVDKLAINIYNVFVHDLNVTWKRHTNQLLSVRDPSGHSNTQNSESNETVPQQESETNGIPQLACGRSLNERVRRPPNRLMFD